MSWLAPQSPDLNPIENLWSILKRKIDKTEVTNKENYFAALRRTWEETRRELFSKPRRKYAKTTPSSDQGKRKLPPNIKFSLCSFIFFLKIKCGLFILSSYWIQHSRKKKYKKINLKKMLFLCYMDIKIKLINLKLS